MLHTLKTTQFIKSDINTISKFMSAPQNLAKITPSHMGFTIVSDVNDLEKIYAGQIIEYDVTPVLGLKMHWVTEITHVKHLHYFVDEQRFGPYTLWHHKHFLKEVDGGVEMIDIIHYKIPFGFIGKIANALFVKHKLKEIFDYRFKKLEELYNVGK